MIFVILNVILALSLHPPLNVTYILGNNLLSRKYLSHVPKLMPCPLTPSPPLVSK